MASGSGFSGLKEDTDPLNQLEHPQTDNLSQSTISTEDESEFCPAQTLNIEDINNIIGVQTNVPVESTFDSEIDALSKVIIDTKGAQLEDEDFKLDSDDISFTSSFHSSLSMESEHRREIFPDDNLGCQEVEKMKKVSTPDSIHVKETGEEPYGKTIESISIIYLSIMQNFFIEKHFFGGINEILANFKNEKIPQFIL